ncbi:MAG: hypothetical protein MJ175_04270 [Clostridia bacterium]|nr:hypothetical protein [Clostridia bacterium]
MEKHLHEGHRKNMRERFLKSGGFGFQDHELLEMLLFYSIPRVNTNEIAHRLLKEFGSVRGVFDASYDALLTVDGVGASSAQIIRLFGELMGRYIGAEEESRGLVVRKPEDTVYYLQKLFFGIGNERSYLLLLSNTGALTDTVLLAEGNAGSVMFDIQKCVRTAVIRNAGFVLAAHNHPHGKAIPSEDDLIVT